MRRVLAALGVTTLAATALAACGNTTGPASTSSMDSLVPSNALLYVSASLSPPATQGKNLVQVVGAFPPARPYLKGQSFSAIEQSLLAQAFAHSPVNYQTDIKPWVGDDVGALVLPLGANGTTPVAMVQTTSASAARAELAKLAAAHHLNARYSLISGFVVLSPSQVGINAVAAQAKAGSGGLTTTAQYRSVTGKLRAGALVTGWANGGALEHMAVSRESSQLSTLPPQLRSLLGGYGAPAGLEGVAFDLSATPSAISSQVVGQFANPPSAPKASLTLAAGLPGDTVGELSIADLSHILSRFLKLIPQASLSAAGQYGISPAQVLPLFSGDTTIVVGPGVTAGKVPDFGVVATEADPAAAKNLVDTVLSAVRRAGVPFTPITSDGEDGLSVASGQAGVAPALAVSGNKLILASSVAYLQQLAHPTANTLGSQPNYSELVANSSGGKSTAQVVVEMAPLLRLIQALYPTALDPGSTADQVLSHLDGFGFRSWTSGNFAWVSGTVSVTSS
ncbi:MAG TPA: DUF3352 domain-containing protein [Acidimicrobiales bacterium]|jgi:hypothetical protein|nr:DUF3352 domain-containing protein [Acidimicrobiales bacterium]